MTVDDWAFSKLIYGHARGEGALALITEFGMALSHPTVEIFELLVAELKYLDGLVVLMVNL